jgi:hypothetical protein
MHTRTCALIRCNKLTVHYTSKLYKWADGKWLATVSISVSMAMPYTIRLRSTEYCTFTTPFQNLGWLLCGMSVWVHITVSSTTPAAGMIPAFGLMLRRKPGGCSATTASKGCLRMPLFRRTTVILDRCDGCNVKARGSIVHSFEPTDSSKSSCLSRQIFNYTWIRKHAPLIALITLCFSCIVTWKQINIHELTCKSLSPKSSFQSCSALHGTGMMTI